MLGGQVLAELDSTGAWARGYVYLGPSLLAVQQEGGVMWSHEDPVTKSRHLTDSSGQVVSAVELDAWGGGVGGRWETNHARQPRHFTTYHRDANSSDEAMHRRYNRWHSRFDQPDPYDGSYDLADPQSLNRYAYVGNDPVNFVDPTGLCGFTITYVTYSDGSTAITSTTWNGPCTANVGGGGGGSMAEAITAMGFGRGRVRPITEFEPRGNGRLGGGESGGLAQPPATRQPIGPTVNDAWRAAYQACLKTRKAHRDLERENRWKEAVTSSFKDGLYGAAGGFTLGLALGRTKIADYIPGIGGKVVGRFGAPAAGAVLGFTSVTPASLIKNFAESGVLFESRMKAHERDDASECIKIANQTVLSTMP